jgi:hypothetical protein
MSNIGREILSNGRIIGTVVEDMGKKLRIRLADGEKRNPVLGDFSIVPTKMVEFADEARLGFAAADPRREAELRRAGGDATLLRR